VLFRENGGVADGMDDEFPNGTGGVLVILREALGVADGTLVMFADDCVGTVELRETLAVLIDAIVMPLESAVVLMSGGTMVDSGTGALEVALNVGPGTLDEGTSELETGTVAFAEDVTTEEGVKVELSEAEDTPRVEIAGGRDAVMLPSGGGTIREAELVASMEDEGIGKGVRSPNELVNVGPVDVSFRLGVNVALGVLEIEEFVAGTDELVVGKGDRGASEIEPNELDETSKVGVDVTLRVKIAEELNTEVLDTVTLLDVNVELVVGKGERG